MTAIWFSVALIWVWLDVALFPEEPGTADATPAVPMVTGLAANTNANTNASTVVTMVTPDRRLRNERRRGARSAPADCPTITSATLETIVPPVPSTKRFLWWAPYRLNRRWKDKLGGRTHGGDRRSPRWSASGGGTQRRVVLFWHPLCSVPGEPPSVASSGGGRALGWDQGVRRFLAKRPTGADGGRDVPYTRAGTALGRLPVPQRVDPRHRWGPASGDGVDPRWRLHHRFWFQRPLPGRGAGP